MVAELQREFGGDQALQRLNADWSGEWNGWTELFGAVAELETARVNCVEECEVAAAERPEDASELSELRIILEENFLVEAAALVQAKLRLFHVLSDRNQPIPGRTDAERCRELEVEEGLYRRHGEVWGRNDCCADSLLQLLIEHRVLARRRAPWERDDACLANRNALCSGPDALRPRLFNGTAARNAYLEVERHAGATIVFSCGVFRRK